MFKAQIGIVSGLSLKWTVRGSEIERPKTIEINSLPIQFDADK